MNPTNTIKLTLTVITLILLINGCSGSSGGAKEDNNTHGLLNTPPVAKKFKTDLNKSVITQRVNSKNTSTKETKVDLTILKTATVKNLELKVEKLFLNKDTTTKLELTPSLSKGKVTQKLKDALKNPEFIVTPKDAIKIDYKTKTITALKDTNVTIQAKIANTLSNKIKLNIYWEVNGHRLPPELDPKVNNSTLLGIDSNNNGVRDDVERWIYEKYKDKHPIYFALMNQAARASREILLHPEEEGRKQINETTKVINCLTYYKVIADWYGDKKLIQENDIDLSYFWHAVYFNTKERNEKLELMSLSASGGAFESVDPKERKDLCSKEVLKVAK